MGALTRSISPGAIGEGPADLCNVTQERVESVPQHLHSTMGAHLLSVPTIRLHKRGRGGGRPRLTITGRGGGGERNGSLGSA